MVIHNLLGMLAGTSFRRLVMEVGSHNDKLVAGNISATAEPIMEMLHLESANQDIAHRVMSFAVFLPVSVSPSIIR